MPVLEVYFWHPVPPAWLGPRGCPPGVLMGQGMVGELHREEPTELSPEKRQGEAKVTLEALSKLFRISVFASLAFHTPQNLLFIALHLIAR